MKFKKRLTLLIGAGVMSMAFFGATLNAAVPATAIDGPTYSSEARGGTPR